MQQSKHVSQYAAFSVLQTSSSIKMKLVTAQIVFQFQKKVMKYPLILLEVYPIQVNKYASDKPCVGIVKLGIPWCISPGLGALAAMAESTSIEDIRRLCVYSSSSQDRACKLWRQKSVASHNLQHVLAPLHAIIVIWECNRPLLLAGSLIPVQHGALLDYSQSRYEKFKLWKLG